jgi:hemoglobin
MTAVPPRFAITPEEIDRVVAEFYASVRSHPGLGPVFAAHVTDWPAHEARIARFWRNAILYEQGYDGNPLAVHRAAGNVRPGMFDAWLGLFDAVLKRNLAPETAAAWSALAHRIGRALRYGLIGSATLPGGVPDLRQGPFGPR